jgi:hypothetical protein
MWQRLLQSVRASTQYDDPLSTVLIGNPARFSSAFAAGHCRVSCRSRVCPQWRTGLTNDRGSVG